MERNAACRQRTVKLVPELDHHSAAQLKGTVDKLINSERPERLILDFGGVKLMDSSGIGFVIGRYNAVKRRGGELFVKNVSARIDRIFRLAGLYQIVKKTK